jgi:nucleoside-diphosphate-sugar epimerase
MRELVLGGEGLIGSALVAELRRRGHEARSLDLKSGFDLRRPFDSAPFEECDRVWFLAWDTGGAKYLEAEDQQHAQYRNNWRARKSLSSLRPRNWRACPTPTARRS